MEAIKELGKEFIKNKERFIQIGYNPQTEVSLYKRIFPGGAIIYEVFKRKINKRFNCVSYPGNNAFGYWALTFPKYEQARYYLDNGFIKPSYANFKKNHSSKRPSSEEKYYRIGVCLIVAKELENKYFINQFNFLSHETRNIFRSKKR